jgi:hypothetical protein
VPGIVAGKADLAKTTARNVACLSCHRKFPEPLGTGTGTRCGAAPKSRESGGRPLAGAAGRAVFRGAGARSLARVTGHRDSEWQYSGKLLLVFSCQYKLVILNVSYWRRSLSGFRRVHALGGVSGRRRS